MTRLSGHLSSALTSDVIASLRAAGICSVEAFLSLSDSDVIHKSGLDQETEIQIRRDITNAFVGRIQSMADTSSETQPVYTTGCPSLDKLLGGGCHPGEITEFCGPAGSGKTQICLTVAALAAARGATVVVVDSSTSVGNVASRMEAILEARGGDEAALEIVQSNVQVLAASTADRVLDILCKIDREMTKSLATAEAGQALSNTASRHRVLVVDSVAAVFGPVVGGPQFQGHALMSEAALLMNKLSSQHDFCVLTTNNVVASQRAVHFAEHPIPKAALGPTWASVPATRVALIRVEPHAQPVYTIQDAYEEQHAVAQTVVARPRWHAMCIKSFSGMVGSESEFAIDAAGVINA